MNFLSPHSSSKPKIHVRVSTPQVANSNGQNSARTILYESGQKLNKDDLLNKSNMISHSDSKLEISRSQGDDSTPNLNAGD